MPLLRDEYKSLLVALKSNLWTLTDLLRQSKLGGDGKFNPVTFAEFDEIDGLRVTVEPVLLVGYNKCSA
jgi:hypothetical protein